jgi:hypothetical protein
MTGLTGTIVELTTGQLMLSIVGPTGPGGATGMGGDGAASISVDNGPPPPGGDIGQQILVGDGAPT